MARTTRQALLAAAGLALAGAVALGVWWAAQAPGAPPAPSPLPARSPSTAAAPVAEPPHPPATLQVLSVTGAVDAGDGAGGWRPLAAGEVLGADQLLRTGPGARAELSAGAASRLTVDERTQLGVRELSAAVHRFRLTRGLVRVDYEPDGDRVVRVEEASGGAVAEARSARFHVAANGLTFAVASRTGTVSLTAAGARVDVAAGEASVAGAGAPPSAPRPIPTDLLLKVAEASRLGGAERCLDTTGQSEPGAFATVDGEPVEVDAAGRFPIRIARRRGALTDDRRQGAPPDDRRRGAPPDDRREGARPVDGVEVRVVAPDGRVTARTFPCRPEPDAQIRDLRVRWKRGSP